MIPSFVFPQYLPVDVADEYFYMRLNSDDWLNATEQEKQAALVQSTRAIDNLNFSGVKFDATQLLEFPRWQGPTTESFSEFSYQYLSTPVISTGPAPIIPQGILVACCENAIALLGGFDFEQEIATLYVRESNYSTVRETYDRTIAVSHLRAGIASGIAWNALKPYLADTGTIHISRVN